MPAASASGCGGACAADLIQIRPNSAAQSTLTVRWKRSCDAKDDFAGTLIPVNRVAADRPFYSGKHKRHGMNLQVIASPGGSILWVSGALPGAVDDKNAEWIWGVLAELEAAGLVVLADKGYQGSTYAKIPYKGKNKPDSQKRANKAHAKLRSPGERANARLKSWRILRSSAAAPGGPGSSPRPSMYCRSVRWRKQMKRVHGSAGSSGSCCWSGLVRSLYTCRLGSAWRRASTGVIPAQDTGHVI